MTQCSSTASDSQESWILTCLHIKGNCLLQLCFNFPVLPLWILTRSLDHFFTGTGELGRKGNRRDGRDDSGHCRCIMRYWPLFSTVEVVQHPVLLEWQKQARELKGHRSGSIQHESFFALGLIIYGKCRERLRAAQQDKTLKIRCLSTVSQSDVQISTDLPKPECPLVTTNNCSRAHEQNWQVASKLCTGARGILGTTKGCSTLLKIKMIPTLLPSRSPWGGQHHRKNKSTKTFWRCVYTSCYTTESAHPYLERGGRCFLIRADA